MNKFEGLIAAPFTPMDGKGEVRYDVIPEYHDFLMKNKVVGAFINGSTGEGASLTQRERMRTTDNPQSGRELMSPVAGLIADRINRKWLIVASLGVWSFIPGNIP